MDAARSFSEKRELVTNINNQRLHIKLRLLASLKKGGGGTGHKGPSFLLATVSSLIEERPCLPPSDLSGGRLQVAGL